MRVGLSARVLIHDEYTLVMLIDVMHTEEWKAAAAAAPRWAATRIESCRRGPGLQVCGA